MKDYIKALKEIENEDEDFELTLSKKEVLDIVEEIEKLNNIINNTIHRIQLLQMDGEVSVRDLTKIANILQGSDKE